MTRRILLAGLVACLSTCRPQQAPEPEYPGALQEPSRFSVDFLLVQELLFRRGEVEEGMRTALQHRGDTLTLVGLTPLGTRAFVLQQRGLDVSFTSYLPEDESLPFPPRFILYDIQRTLLPVLDDRPLSDGEHRLELGDEDVVERWRGHRLLERRYRRRDGDPSGELVITYGEGGYLFGTAPPSIEIDNGWLGYQLTLTTTSYQRLDGAGTTGSSLP